MLKRAPLLVALLVAGAASAAPDALRTPERLTAALSDELLGQLSPDGRRLYFVSNRDETNQIFTQELAAPSPALLFDESADVTWPRVSPDGKQLLYISYRDDAAGRLCVRKLATLERRCLADEVGALQATWRNDREILLSAANSPEGNLRLLNVRTDGAELRATLLGERNLTGPAVSPDGRWLVFVPVERIAGRLGPAFAAQAARVLILQRLDRGPEQPIALELPGATGQPAFSADGRWLYFTQFPNDTDQNGVLDGNDHGVAFRVPFDGARDDAAAIASKSVPEQLTNAAWNCQYPMPARDALILTCAHGGSLGLYRLPPDGIVPESWSAGRIREEIESSRNRWEQLLLLHRLERAERDPEKRGAMTLDVIRLHLLVGEYESAAFHAHVLGARGAPGASALAPALEVLIAHRRGLRGFDRGHVGARFLATSHQQLDALHDAPGEPPAVATLRHLVRGEILDHLGDKSAALAELAAATVDDQTPRFLVWAAAARAEALHRELDQSDALTAALRKLVEHPSLDEADRLTLGLVYARAVGRGLPRAQSAPAYERELARAPAGSATAYALALVRCLDRIAPESGDGRACVSELYAAHPALVRRRVLTAEVVRRAEETDAATLEYELVRRFTADVPRDSAERRHAERLFRHVVEDHAYGELAAGRAAEARAEFAAILQEVASLESHVGYLEASLAAGLSDEGPSVPSRPSREGEQHFRRAYLALRRLTALDGAPFERACAEALAELQAAERALPQKAELRALHGALLHLRWLRLSDHAAAEEAGTHYLLALDLAHENPRYRAMALEQLGQLHADVGNWRIAIGHLDERAKLPFPDAGIALAHHVTRARALFHLGRDAEAAAAANEALALLERTPTLARFRPLVLDRAAFYALAAGEGKRAVELYGRATDAAAETQRDVGRNRVVQRLARAAARLQAGEPAAALADLDVIDREVADPAVLRVLGWPRAAPGEVAATYHLLRLGLRAQTERALGHFDAATRALTARRQLLLARVQQRTVDEDQLALALAGAQLAELAAARHSPAEAARLASEALGYADTFAKRTGTPLTDAQLAVLGLSAELLLGASARATDFTFDLPARLRAAYTHLCTTHNPARALARRRFAIYLTLLRLDGR